MIEDKIVDIEVKLAHQDQLLIDLDKVVTDQQTKIMQLEELVASLVARVRSIGDAMPPTIRSARRKH